MFGYTYHQTIRKASAVFGTLFNNVKIKRYDSSGNVTETMTVPLRYAPKTKWYSRVFAENRPVDDNGEYAMKVPSMGFEMTSLLYDTTRKTNRLNQIRQGNAVDGSLIQGYHGAPYSLDYTLYVFANKTADWSQIIEQIVPNFNPTFNVPIKMIDNQTDGSSIVQDVSITLTSVSPDANMYGDFRSRQTYTWALSFTMNLNIFGRFGEPSDTIGGAAIGGTDPAITINFYTDEDGSMTISGDDIPVEVLEIPEL